MSAGWDRTGKKTPGGAGTHTGHTSAHADIRRTQTNLLTSQASKPNDTPARPRDSRNPKPRPTQQQPEQPQARSRPLPTADSEEAAPSEPDPASTRPQSASPRLLEGGRRNEGARGRCVTAGGAARAPDELEAREAETGNGRGEARTGKKTEKKLTVRIPAHRKKRDTHAQISLAAPAMSFKLTMGMSPF